MGAGGQSIETVIFILTATPDNHCGVADYTRLLASSIRREGIKVNVEELDAWSYRALINLRHKYSKCSNSLIHVQYPSMGMRYSIIPGILPFVTQPSLITIHEFECLNLLRKFLYLPYTILSQHIIIPDEYELEQFNTLFPFAKAKTIVIPIGKQRHGFKET